MSWMNCRRGVVALLGLAALCTQFARAAEGQDHPAVAAYPSAKIEKYDYKEYEEAQLLLSKPYLVHGKYKADKVLPVEGQVTYIHYRIPGSASALQVLRNYQSSLRRSGFQELFVCERPCINDNLGDLRELLKARDLYLNGHQDVQYLAAQRGNTYVSLAVNTFGSGSDTYAWLFVIDKGSLDDGKMAISGESPMALALAASGKVDVYGFQFDTGKAQLKSGSDATLRELAKVMTDNPDLRIDVVGHTDDVGQADANLALSLARAQAVTTALTQQHAVAAERVAATGQGASQPVALNTNEAGRAKNRRVEIIVRAPAANTAAPVQQRQPRMQRAPVEAPTPTPKPEENKPTVGERTRNALDTLNSIKGLFGR